MKIFTSLLLFLFCFNFCATAAYKVSPYVIDNGGGVPVVSGGTYKSMNSIGQSVIDSSQMAERRTFTGYVPAIYNAPSPGVIYFTDEYPSSSNQQNTSNVDCGVTIKISGGAINISSIKYRISNSGDADGNFSLYISSGMVTTDVLGNGTEVRCHVTIPNSVGNYFTESENNYIQWWCRTISDTWNVSSKYKIRILQNDVPQIVIKQPKDEEFTGERLVIEADVTDTRWGINPSSVTITIDEYSGVKNVFTTTSLQKPEIYNSTTSVLYYQMKDVPLQGDKKYTLTVTATDKNNVVSTKSVNFTVKSGAIADLIPYPCPFDPKVQPINIRYVLNKQATVTVNIYDASGGLIRTVIENTLKEPGFQEEKWYGDNYADDTLANGVYFCEIIAKDEDGEHRRYTSLAIFGK